MFDAGYGCHLAWCIVRANHRAHESLFYASLGHIRVLGGLDLCSSSTALKANCLVIRYLYFISVRGDLQEGHGCSSRCQLPHFGAYPSLPEHKIGIFVRFCQQVSSRRHPRPATNLIRRRSTPVWLAIWSTWAEYQLFLQNRVKKRN